VDLSAKAGVQTMAMRGEYRRGQLQQQTCATANPPNLFEHAVIATSFVMWMSLLCHLSQNTTDMTSSERMPSQVHLNSNGFLLRSALD
jgi:hypothetical protein